MVLLFDCLLSVNLIAGRPPLFTHGPIVFLCRWFANLFVSPPFVCLCSGTHFIWHLQHFWLDSLLITKVEQSSVSPSPKVSCVPRFLSHTHHITNTRSQLFVISTHSVMNSSALALSPPLSLPSSTMCPQCHFLMLQLSIEIVALTVFLSLLKAAEKKKVNLHFQKLSSSYYFNYLPCHHSF